MFSRGKRKRKKKKNGIRTRASNRTANEGAPVVTKRAH